MENYQIETLYERYPALVECKEDIEKAVREAQQVAQEDKQRKEEVDTRNNADQMVYQCEKLLSEEGDKFDEADKAALAKRNPITFGGIVTNVREGLTKRGTPCGFVTIEDYEGSGEIAFFDDWAVTMSCESRWGNKDNLQLRVTNVEYMQDYADKMIKKITLSINLDDFDEEISNNLTALINDDAGNLDLYIQVHNSSIARNVTLHSKSKKVSLNKKFIDFLDSVPCIDYFIN